MRYWKLNEGDQENKISPGASDQLGLPCRVTQEAALASPTDFGCGSRVLMLDTDGMRVLCVWCCGNRHCKLLSSKYNDYGGCHGSQHD
eukprot:3607559-Rhodomonas_salina.2